MTITRTCPGCSKFALQAVTGGRGKMGQCPGCGWTGALRLEDEPKKQSSWPGVRIIPQDQIVDDGIDVLAAIVARDSLKKKIGN